MDNKQQEELTVKRSYTLKSSTVKRLQILKALAYDENVQFSEIVDEAINSMFEEKSHELNLEELLKVKSK